MRTIFTLSLMLIVITGFSQQVFQNNNRQQTGLTNDHDAKLSGLECNIVSSFSTAPTATIGLDNQGSHLWVSFTSVYDFIVKMDTLGNILDSISLPFLGAGVDYDDIEVSGTKLWVIAEGPPKLFEVNLTNEDVTEIALPAFDMEPYHYFSCAFDGQFLWVLNYQTPSFETRLYKMDTATHAIIDSVDLAHPVVTIEMIENELWGYCVAQCFPEKMFRINTATGAFTDSSEWCVSNSAYGMAWDGNSLWQTAGFNQLIHKIDIGLNIAIPPVVASPSSLTAFPNPAANSIEFSTDSKGLLIIRNICGTETARIAADGRNIPVSVNTYPAGMYSAYLYDSENRIVSAVKFAVQR